MSGSGAVTAGPAIEVRGLVFGYPQGPPVLCELSLTLAAGARALLLGANGAGKTTLLRVLGGRHLVPEAAVRVLGRPAFHATELAARVALIAGDFPFRADLAVAEILAAQPGLDPARVEHVRAALDVDPAWRMARVSDGQRRRVQLLLHLARPAELVLLDEVTADLDVLARADLLELLRRDADERGTTVLYATHVLDGLERWATHLCFLRAGRLHRLAPLEDVVELQALRAAGEGSPLLRLCERWLREERSEPVVPL